MGFVMFDATAEVAAVRSTYGPEEERALAVYGDVVAAFDAAGLPAYVETRGGLAICAYAPDGAMLVVACQDFLPLNRVMVTGWHLAHVPEDGPSPKWRCIVHDTVPDDLCCDEPGALRLRPLVDAAKAHLAACDHTREAATAAGGAS
ncbi:hypothetical protein AVL59_32665 [Streptomyces griseochromogenes]|uniref:Uncharacterized protein n=2 Tax=Streptomyces griseochromogenes TaxID=68214 RepID=A0A1B1B4E3_9ACTN|nr:hypothetical protein AVL59_32665 [Streptomyces griseochromogenes]